MIASSTPIGTTDVAGHYDDLDHYYRLLWGEHLHHGLWLTGKETPELAMEQLIERVATALNLGEGDVVDVGCGYGATSRFLSDRFRMTGLTISPRQFEFATNKTQGAANPRFLLENWETNSLASSSADGIVSIECIAHVPDKNRYFEQVFRVLKPGGRAAITAWLTSDAPSQFSQNWLLEPICREGRLPAMGTLDEYKQMAEQAGLKVVYTDDLSLAVSRTWSICFRRVIYSLLFTRDGWQFLFGTRSRHFVFVFTVARILMAYANGSMKYGFLVFEKPTVE